MATFAIADIHGNFLGLTDVLKKCKFKKTDTLICLGDSVDGGNRSKDVINKLLTIPKLINIIGNHEKWFINWAKTGIELPIWWNQGGQRTAESYIFDYKNVPQSHIDFLEHARPYHIDEKHRVFVHGGFDPDKPIEMQDVEFLTWDRDLLCKHAPLGNIKGYDHIFVGHTSTQFFNSLEPVTFGNVTDLDTGSGWNGRLTIMNIDTFQFWQSNISANMQNEMSLYQEKFIF